MAEHIYAETVVIGGGTAGAAVAARLVQAGSQSVLLIESGPDYGAFAEGRLARATAGCAQSARAVMTGVTSMAQAQVVRNICWSGHASLAAAPRTTAARRSGAAGSDYDGWAAAGNDGWSADDLLPFFKLATETLRVKRISSSEITPWQQACLDTAPKIGIPHVDDLNNLDEDIGMSTSPVNIVDGVRWNTAFAYLDPLRGSRSLTILGGMQVDRLRLEGNRVIAMEAIGPEGPVTIEAGRVVVCAGSYGSPAILLRSGIGPAAELHALGIETKLDLAVGKNLHDHPAVYLKYSGTPRLVAAMLDFAAKGGTLFSEQTIAKARSKYCTTAYDLHLFPVGGQFKDAADQLGLFTACSEHDPALAGTGAIDERRSLCDPQDRHGVSQRSRRAGYCDPLERD